MFIYAITNTLNGKVYIGKTSGLVNKRWNQHLKLLRKNLHINSHLQNAWNLYGESTFLIEELATAESAQQLNELEIETIKLYKSSDIQYGYNMSFGGDGGRLTNKVYKKMSINRIGRKLSEQHKRNISSALKGREITWKDKISASNKGMKPSSLAVQKSKEKFTGSTLSLETKRRISISVRDAYNKMPTEFRLLKNEKISKAQKGKLAGGIEGYRNATTAKRIKKENRVPKELLLNLICQGLTIRDIAIKFNVGATTISRMRIHYWNKSIKQLKMECEC